MRISFFILIILISLCSFGQKKTDTLNLLMSISETYMKSMYINQNFDSASKMWDSSVFIEARNYYLIKKQQSFADSTINNILKTAYSSYYLESTEFKILDLGVYSFRTPIDNLIEVRLLYHCSERIRGKLKKIRVGLYFISHDRGKNWMIQDSKTVDISNRYN